MKIQHTMANNDRGQFECRCTGKSWKHDMENKKYKHNLCFTMFFFLLFFMCLNTISYVKVVWKTELGKKKWKFSIQWKTMIKVNSSAGVQESYEKMIWK